MASAPDLSVVLPADSARQAAHAVRAFGQQFGADRVELVLVSPAEPPIEVSELADADRFWGVEVVTVPDHGELHRSRAAGIRAARAPIVALAETHAFPQRGWLDAVLAAFARDGETVVGPAMTNATSRTAIGWSNFLLDYGPWAEPVEPGDGSSVPGHNSVFRREALLALGDDLESLLRIDLMLIERLVGEGGRVKLAPAARVAHLSVERVGPWLRERLLAGQLFATTRASDWSGGRRFVYALASPAIPLIRAPRVRSDFRRTRDQQPAPRRVALVTAVGLLASALGEHLGYAYGISRRARGVLYDIELDRVRYVRRG